MTFVWHKTKTKQNKNEGVDLPKVGGSGMQEKERRQGYHTQILTVLKQANVVVKYSIAIINLPISNLVPGTYSVHLFMIIL